MKFKTRLMLGLLGSLSLIYALFYKNQAPSLPVVAIAQIIHHNTLEQVRQGLLEGLREEGYEDGKNIRIIYENANGNMAVAAQSSERLLGEKPKVLVALSTQSAQLLKPLAQQAKIPLIFSAVTDPISANLVSQWDAPNQFVTGVSDYMPPEPQLEMIRKIVPNKNRLGILFNPSEVNSVAFLDAFTRLAQQQGWSVQKAPANNTAEAITAVQSLVGKVDAIYFPNDNTIMAAAAAVASVSKNHHIPLFANDEASVKDGVLAALSYDRIAMGKHTAKMVSYLLKGGKIQDLSVTNKIPYKLVENEETKLSLSTPAS